MSAPKRIQMTRQRPWRAENPDAVIVARPSKWGNPMRVVAASSCGVSPKLASQWRNAPHWHTLWPEGGSWCYETKAGAVDRAVEVFGLRVPLPVGPLGRVFDYPLVDEIERDLAGRDLACWCPLDSPCHADVLLSLAAGGA